MKYAKELDKLCIKDRLLMISYRKWKKFKTLGSYWKIRIIFELMISPRYLLETNLKTIYKLCKRFEKRGIANDSKEFYTRISKMFSKIAVCEFI